MPSHLYSYRFPYFSCLYTVLFIQFIVYHSFKIYSLCICPLSIPTVHHLNIHIPPFFWGGPSLFTLVFYTFYHECTSGLRTTKDLLLFCPLSFPDCSYTQTVFDAFLPDEPQAVSARSANVLALHGQL